MSDEVLERQINDLLNGTISETEHRQLQEQLKSDKSARDLFRERMDIEAGLRTWASDGLIAEQTAEISPRPSEQRTEIWSRWKVAVLTVSALILIIGVRWVEENDPAARKIAEQQHQITPQETNQTITRLGRLVQQADCVWEQSPALQQDSFLPGTIKLASGAAELRFDSGTNVILEAPCELKVETVDSARLLAGTVFVNVTEVSNGFLLETPEAQIIDEGTQYAVSLDSQATEVHVFDGSVIWSTDEREADFEERISSGEARRYLHNEPGRSHHIPFGQRQFVRRIEQAVREAGGEALLAYDGFENLAGQLRRGRSGFGWASGWESIGRGRGPLAEVIDAPDDVVFGINRADRRLLALQGGDNLRRRFDKTIKLSPGNSLFISLIIHQQSATDNAASSIQVFLEPDSESPRYTRRHAVSFGVTSDGHPFVNNAGTIDESATTLAVDKPLLVVLKLEMHDDYETLAKMRVYQKSEKVDLTVPSGWTIQGRNSKTPSDFASIRFTLDKGSEVQIDELRLGRTWESVTEKSNEGEE